MQIIVQMENNSGALLYIGSAYISSKKIIIFVTHPLFVTSLLAYFHSNTTTHIDDEGSDGKKIKIQNKAELTRNEASMGAEFLFNSALFCIFIFFASEPSSSMCVDEVSVFLA